LEKREKKPDQTKRAQVSLEKKRKIVFQKNILHLRENPNAFNAPKERAKKAPMRLLQKF